MNNYQYNGITLGLEEEFFYKVTEEKMALFLALTGDENPMHCDANYARARGFDGQIVYGMLNAALCSTMAGMYLPGKNSLVHRVDINFIKPVYVDDTVRVCGKVVDKNDKYHFIVVKIDIYNEKEIKVCRGKMDIGVLA